MAAAANTLHKLLLGWEVTKYLSPKSRESYASEISRVSLAVRNLQKREHYLCICIYIYIYLFIYTHTT